MLTLILTDLFLCLFGACWRNFNAVCTSTPHFGEGLRKFSVFQVQIHNFDMFVQFYCILDCKSICFEVVVQV